MRIKFLLIIASFLIVSLSITSCLDDEEVAYSNDATISSFSLNDIYFDTIPTWNPDTVLIDTVYASQYKFTIDQISNQIYNRDSLPFGTNLNKVSVNIGINGYLIYQKDGQDIVWNSTDSLNFTHPINFTAYAADGTTSRKYEIKVNVHKLEPDSLIWKQVSTEPVIAQQKSILFNDQIYIFAHTDNGVTISELSSNGNLNQLSNLTDGNYYSVVVFKTKVYLTTQSGETFSSSDCIGWTKVETGSSIGTFICAFYEPAIHTRLYTEHEKLIGITTDNKYIYTKNGSEWHKAGNIPANFPTSKYSATPAYKLGTNNDIEKVVIANNIQVIENDTAFIWSALSNNSLDWAQLSPEENNTNYCPQLRDISIIHYDNQLFTFGGSGKNTTPFQYFYSSTDNGVTWTKIERQVCFPTSFANIGNYSCIVDKNNYIWIISDQGIWKGRINRLNPSYMIR